MKYPPALFSRCRCVLCGDLLVAETPPPYRRASVCPGCWNHLLRWRYSSYAIRCPICGEVRLQKSVPCPRCHGVPANIAPEGRVIYSGPYLGDGKTLLVSYKFHARSSLAPPIAVLLLLELADRYKAEPLALIPVPSSRKNRRRRGWDQMRLVCRRIATGTRRVTVIPALVRIGDLEQKSLGREQRLSQSDARFMLSPMGRAELSNRLVQEPRTRFIVVDDVYTTGSTIDACRSLIVSAVGTGHADKVEALVLCRD